jgi:tRNA threonylcarbamoyladenosine biosynthesis protein TsaB
MTDVLLAIEASQRTAGVAVRDGRGEAHVEWVSSAVRYDDDLLPAINRLYGRLGLPPSRTRAVGVSVGPGGFTGLRIAVATAKALAEALGAKIVSVPTALVAAESCEGPGPILVALASKGETTWVTRLDRAGGGAGTWRIEVEGHIVDAESVWLNEIKSVLGDRYLPGAVRARCEQAGVAVVDPIFSPLACLSVAARLFEKSHTVDPLVLAPIYPRPPAAVTIWERRSRS